jgi:Concanavalin A-like lectin/glucanases superfamily
MGSDLWPTAWAADGNLYGAWGDGGGFSDSQSNATAARASLGFARITGTPVAGNASSFAGRNIWGQAPEYAKYQAPFGGKVSDLFSVDGVLYGQANLWTDANCGCSDPTRKSGGNKNNRTLIWSSDLGRSWTIAPWKGASAFGSFLQFGQDYQGAFDPDHLYFYYSGDANSDPAHVYLRRMARNAVKEDPATRGHFEYFAGVDSSGSPYWTRVQSNAQPVFSDSSSPAGQGTGLGVVFDAPLGRYVAIESHGEMTGQIGVFEAPSPWGPWATIAYYDNWGGFNETSGAANGMYFPSKWISPDGLSLWAVFSGLGEFDSFNVAQAVLQVNAAPPVSGAPPVAPPVKAPQPMTAAAGQWTFDAGTGSSAADSSDNGNDGTLINSPQWIAGVAGRALNFDGDGNAVRMSGSGGLANLDKGGLTVSAWIRPATAGAGGRGRIVDKDNNDAGWFFSMYTSNNIQFAVDQFDGANPSRISTAAVDLNRWQHVVATWDGSTSGSNIHLYVDGVLVDGGASSGSGARFDDSGTPLTVGNRAGDLARGFDGGIDEVQVYDRVLSASEIQTLASRGEAGE